MGAVLRILAIGRLFASQRLVGIAPDIYAMIRRVRTLDRMTSTGKVPLLQVREGGEFDVILRLRRYDRGLHRKSYQLIDRCNGL